MRFRMLFLAFVAVAVVGLGATGSVAAERQAAYIFRGELVAAPQVGPANSLLLKVAGGNHRALRLMVGQPPAQSFAVGANTEYLRWVHGVPTVVQQSNLAEGDQLTVRIRAPRSSSLAQVEATPANVVADYGPKPGRPLKPLWLFEGLLNAPPSSTSLSIHVTDGNHRALKAMLGQAQDQSFAYGRRTVFIRWQGRVPTLISPSQLRAGDRISVRIRASGTASLAQVESTRANHVAAHEAPPSP